MSNRAKIICLEDVFQFRIFIIYVFFLASIRASRASKNLANAFVVSFLRVRNWKNIGFPAKQTQSTYYVVVGFGCCPQFSPIMAQFKN